MRKSILGAFLLVTMSAAVVFSANGDPKTGVVASVHDMRGYGNSANDAMDRVCAYCHTPHHSATAGNDYLPLWSHEISSEALQPYWSQTIQAQVDPGDFLMGPSKLCMSCHDGSIAVDQHYNTPGTAKLSGDNYLEPTVGEYNGSSLTNDHPIGFVYNNVAAAPSTGEIPGTDTSGSKDNYIRMADTNLKYKGNSDSTLTVESRLWNGYMTCATCHDVHNKKNMDLTGVQNYLVLSPQAGSQLCLTCHMK